MADISWGKSSPAQSLPRVNSESRVKFLVVGALLIAAVVYLIVVGTGSGARYFITVEELVNNPDYLGKTVRISGAVVGDTIVYDSQNLIIDFTIANIPEETTDLARTLYEQANDPNAVRIPVHIENQVKPDLLQHEAQAILSGTLGVDGVFYATELLLKCPSRYEEAVPVQAET